MLSCLKIIEDMMIKDIFYLRLTLEPRYPYCFALADLFRTKITFLHLIWSKALETIPLAITCLFAERETGESLI
jgi:hypothetical protein